MLTENELEQTVLSWLAGLGCTVLSGPDIAPGELLAERAEFGEVVLKRRLSDSIAKLNPSLESSAIDEAIRKLLHPSNVSLIRNNHAIHNYLVNGVPIDITRPDGGHGVTVRVIDFEKPDNNDWLAVNQFAVIEGKHSRRPDIVLFVNGLPLSVIELKNPADENATIWSAFNQLQTYKQQIPSLFLYNAALIISDGLEARIGTLTADRERFMPWRTIEGEELASSAMPQLEVLLKGAFDKRRFLDLIRHFIVFEDEGSGQLVKKMAGYHQFHAVNAAVEETLRAADRMSHPEGVKDTELGKYYSRADKAKEKKDVGDRRVGVVWHTQGSGKSLTMAFYAGKVILHPAMENPTLVVITDRNDLDDQLFGTFSRCHELLRQAPVQAQDRKHLRELLQVASGGVVFTTIQKFFPESPSPPERGSASNGAGQPSPQEGRGGYMDMLSDRKNIVVIADEAHRSQYDFIDGYARHMRDALPNASFIGFTGTPIELTDKNTRAVFGDYISIYDIQRAVLDRMTVPIYYESRYAKLDLDAAERPSVDTEFDEATEGEEVERKEKLKTKWAALEAVVGTEKRVGVIARDLVEHFEKRLEAMDGKAMVVCMSRRICMDLYDAIVKLRPGWHSEDDEKGAVKVVMTGNASEGPRIAGHSRSKQRREAIATRFKNPKDDLKVVIVRDMWLTGFDVPCLHTMYVDKPMRGHGLMQAIARVNRVFRDKPGGLVVDYLGLADQLRNALAAYTESGGTGKTAIDQKEAVAIMLEKYEICLAMFHGFDWAAWKTGKAAAQLGILPAAQEHILKQEDGKARLVKAVTDLSNAFALSVPHEDALRIRDDVAFFQAVKAALVKSDPRGGKTEEEMNLAIQQIVSRAIAPGEVIDIFAAAGLKKPDISILSDEFLAEVKGMPQKNLAVELLRKLLNNEIKTRAKRHLVQARSFSEMLETTIRRYQNRAIETAQIIEELIGLARDMRQAEKRGEDLGLNDEEVAFYEALEVNDSAVKVLGDETLKAIARELVETVRKNTSIDWTVKESVKAKLRVIVKRILRKYGYPPDKQERATQTVLQQAELLAPEWAG